MARTSDRSASGRRSVPRLAADLLGLLNDLTRGMFDPYRPELHYMRGPGPKWHAKYGRGSTHFDSMPALARIHVKR